MLRMYTKTGDDIIDVNIELAVKIFRDLHHLDLKYRTHIIRI